MNIYLYPFYQIIVDLHVNKNIGFDHTIDEDNQYLVFHSDANIHTNL